MIVKLISSAVFCLALCALFSCMKFDPFQMPYNRFATMYFLLDKESILVAYVSNDSMNTIVDYNLDVRECDSGKEYELTLTSRCLSKKEMKDEKIKASFLPNGMPYIRVPVKNFNVNTDMLYYFDVIQKKGIY